MIDRQEFILGFIKRFNQITDLLVNDIRKGILNMKTILVILSFLIMNVCLIGQDKESIVLELKEELKLNDEQTDSLSSLIDKFVIDLKAVVDKNDTEEPDPKTLLQDIKVVRGQFNEELEQILTEEQMEKYLAYVDQVLNEIIGDIAEIKLLDLKPVLELTDDQITQLRPVLTKSIKGVLSTIWEYVDKRMGMRNKAKIGKTLKKIQSEAQEAAAKILSPNQLKAWEEYKEKMKSETDK